LGLFIGDQLAVLAALDGCFLIVMAGFRLLGCTGDTGAEALRVQHNG
jgi:hypothetical protein